MTGGLIFKTLSKSNVSITGANNQLIDFTTDISTNCPTGYSFATLIPLGFYRQSSDGVLVTMTKVPSNPQGVYVNTGRWTSTGSNLTTTANINVEVIYKKD